jgi:hypothetical protein
MSDIDNSETTTALTNCDTLGIYEVAQRSLDQFGKVI